MGRFMLYNGKVRPSDSYLISHSLSEYKPGDLGHPDYDLEDDREAMSILRYCSKCGKMFRLTDTLDEYHDNMLIGPEYVDKFVGDLCGECAAFEMKGLMDNT